MIAAWLAEHGLVLLLALVAGGYAAFYVLAIRTQRRDPRKPKLPTDRC